MQWHCLVLSSLSKFPSPFSKVKNMGRLSFPHRNLHLCNYNRLFHHSCQLQSQNPYPGQNIFILQAAVPTACIFFTFYTLPSNSFPELLKASYMLSAALPELLQLAFYRFLQKLLNLPSLLTVCLS